LKRFFKTIVALSLSALMLMSCASAATTAYHYPEARLVIVSGTTDSASIRKPVTLSLEDSYGTIYTAQKRAYDGKFEFRIPVELIYELNEYTLKLNVNGNYSEETITLGDKFTVDTSWNAVTKTLTISGVSVYRGYTTDEVAVTIKDLNSDSEVVYESSCYADDRFDYSIPVDFTSFDFSRYEVTVSNGIELDTETVIFDYRDIDTIIASTKEEGANVMEILVNDMEILDMASWTAVDGSTVDELPSEVFDILTAEIQDVDNTDELKLALNKAVFVDYINKSISGEDVFDVVDNYSGSFFDIEELTLYPLFDSYEDITDKFQALEGLAGSGIEAFADVEKAFNDTILLDAINSAPQWSNIQDVAEDYCEYLELDGKLLKEVCEKLHKYKENTPFEDIDIFVAKAEAYTEDAEDDDDDDDNKVSSPSRYPSSTITNNTPPAVVTPIETPVIFDDIADVDWAEYEITELYKKGIVNGVSDKKFDPNAPVTREQFVKMLVIAFGITEEGTGVSDFDDVDFRAWYANYVKLAATNGIVTGKGDGTFGVGEAITRQDAATLIYRLITVKEGEEITPATFGDEAVIADYAKEAVAYLSAKNVINGVGNGNFEPMTICTRAQAAKIIYQVLAVK
jgi:hypothetical protein